MKAEKLSQERLLALQDLDSSLMQLEHKANNLPLSKLLDEKRLEFASARDLAVAASTERSDIKHELSKSELDVEQVLSTLKQDLEGYKVNKKTVQVPVDWKVDEKLLLKMIRLNLQFLKK